LDWWISSRYGPFSLGARFETYEPFISLIFHCFPRRGKPRITEMADTESVRECLLSFGAESIVSYFAIQKFKD
jgi:hypothetical protein